jgi:heterodisulfide reductase subunit B
MSTYLYYPGCSMEANAIAYHESLMAICGHLDLKLNEIEDWNCCGATEYVGVSLTPAYALMARNLALAARQANGCRTVVAPCSACYLNLAKADYYMKERPLLGERVNTALAAGGLSYEPGSLDIRHLLDVIIYDIGLDTVRSKVVRPLKGLKVAPYLGCMVPRPDYKKRWSDHERPNELDRLLDALGAHVVDYPLRSHCCGGHMTQIGPETAYELIRRLISSATGLGAHVMVTLCPMCQMNVDAYQADTNRHFGTNYHMPVLFFTQLMGLAFGIAPEKLGFGREFVSATEALKNIGVETPPPDEPVRRTPSRRDKSLPMPRMPGAQEGKR